MYLKLFHPSFTPEPFEKKIAQSLYLQGQQSSQPGYQHLLLLEAAAHKAAAGFYQLKQLIRHLYGKKETQALNRVEKAVETAVLDLLDGMNIDNRKKGISKAFQAIAQTLIDDETINKNMTNCTLFTNTMASLLLVAGIGLSVMLICTGPFALSILGVGLAMCTAALLSLTAYSCYIQTKFLLDAQLEDINDFIETLFEKPEAAQEQERLTF